MITKRAFDMPYDDHHGLCACLETRHTLRSAVDVAALGLTFYLRSLDRDASLIAVPAFPDRVFRHSCVFVHAESGITPPGDLVDPTIGEFASTGRTPACG